jgi:nanoRNase/pAp phosphatase (c-di-AMP/oligoRNAs hydrolase)
MARNDQEQIQSVLQKSKHILIALKKNPSGDALSAGLALALFCKQLGKHVDIVSENFELPKKFAFLPEIDLIKKQMPHLQKFIIRVDVKNHGLQELSYDVKDGHLLVYITPEHGFFTHEQLRTAQTDFRYDLIVTLDTPDFDSLGELYTKNTELFYKVPVLNIDTSVANDYYGTLNDVDITASSTSEVVTVLLQGINESLLNKEIATTLLTGMICATQSFKTKNVKPQALTLASKLVGIGADRDFIIGQLYRTKTLSTLKLWGQALANLQYNPSLGLVRTSITRENFIRSGASELELYDIIDELIMNSPEAKMVLLVHEDVRELNTVQVILHTTNGFNAKYLTEEFHPQGEKKQVAFSLKDKNLKDAEEEVVHNIREKLNQ